MRDKRKRKELRMALRFSMRASMKFQFAEVGLMDYKCDWEYRDLDLGHTLFKIFLNYGCRDGE